MLGRAVREGKCKWGVGDTIGKKWMEKFWRQKMGKKLLSAKSDWKSVIGDSEHYSNIPHIAY